MFISAGWAYFPLSGLVLVHGCSIPSLYRGGYDWPPDPPVPASASVIASDRGWDNDDPIRSALLVVDVGTMTTQQLVDSTRAALSEADGWHEQVPGEPLGTDVLCLVREGAAATEVVEIWRYEGTRVDEAPGRYLLARSAFYSAYGPPPHGGGMCGVSLGWAPTDMFR